jgi:uncharacterized membrane protein
MAGDNLVLHVATHNDRAAAASGYKTLKDAEGSEKLVVGGSVVVSRDDEGKVAVKETGGGGVGRGALIGGGAGAIVGLFAHRPCLPPRSGPVSVRSPASWRRSTRR